MESEILSGGEQNQVEKIGDAVHRKIRGHLLLHTYLLYLEKEGMDGVPRFLGLDEQGREILTYLPGKTMGPDIIRMTIPAFILTRPYATWRGLCADCMTFQQDFC